MVMKIRLKQNIPVDKKHGMTAGRILETIDPSSDEDPDGIWVMGDTRKAVKILPRECEVLK